MKKNAQTISVVLSCIMHGMIVMLLFISLERTVFIPADPTQDQNKPIIDAVMVDNKTLQQEVARLDAIEANKRQEEQARQLEMKQKREKEEAQFAELKKKNEQLKKEAIEQKLKLQKQEAQQQAKLKAEQEELKKIQEQKEVAKKKADEERKASELAKKKQEEQKVEEASAASAKVKQDQISQHAMLIQAKIKQNWRQPVGMSIAGFKCKLAVKLLPTGEVVDAQVIESSGNLAFDRSSELAIHKASPLPMPDDTEVAKIFRQFTFTFHPEAA